MYEDLVSQITESNGKSIVRIKVKPSASKTKLVYRNGLFATICADPKQGKANRELVALLNQVFQTDDIKIVSGHKSRIKLIKIGLKKDEIISQLSNLQ